MQADLVCDTSNIDHQNHKDSPATTSMDDQIQNFVNHSGDTSSKLGDPDPSDSNSTNCIRPDQDDSINEDDAEELPCHLELFDLKYPADGSGYAAPANGYQEWNVGLKHLMNKRNHEIKKCREAKRTRCLAQGLPAESLESRRLRKKTRVRNLASWVFEDKAATSFTICTKGERQVPSEDDLGITEDDVGDLPIHCDILHLRYPADESGYAAPAKGYQEFQDSIKEKRYRSRRMGKAKDAGMRQQCLDQDLLAEDSEDRQHREYPRARWRAEKEMLGEDASDIDTSLSDDEFASAPWVFKELIGPRLSGDRRVKNHSRTPPNPLRETMDTSENISPEDQEIQQKVARLRESKYRVFSKPGPRNFIPLFEFERLTREERRAKGIPTPPRSPSPLHSLFDGCVGDGPRVPELQETEAENIPINDHGADAGESSPTKTHDHLDRVIPPHLQPTVEPGEDESIFSIQQSQGTENMNEKEAVTEPQGIKNQDKSQEASRTEVLAANTLSRSSRISADMPKYTSGEPGSPRYRKLSIDVSTDDELLMYDKMYGTNIRVEPMDPDDTDVVMMSEFDFMEWRMGIPTSPSSALSPSESASTETSLGSSYERVKKLRHPRVGQKWNRRRPQLASPKQETRKRHWGNFGRYCSSEEETETEVTRSDTKHRTRKGYREHRRAVPVQDTSEDVNIIIDLYLNIDPELQAKVSYGKQKSGDCNLGDFTKSPVDAPAPELEAQRDWFNIGLESETIMTGLVGLAVGLAAGMAFRRFK
ncbi:hypothetical protein H112_05214 [Trichophyton rubrum D6]|nr:uncharacterized protein TERG_02965 [Trichophyton rubrum CBS 118892]EZF20536.1 hypothetical protein H100_05236 [Trichophyton rubrum MR850]EZF40862.1 hypothetical protein H102_05226 [Trichophyton rubrum CBS 100081]EZF51748.1 hypothetical protein H103_05225 [Trichophyton rubrum CBS 288.86]EZF62156.1 hypothetical protein H104_05217 [Trichophyton rubrum CBS 289.86]EZF83404.1 hypothetical protein H110_05224 [Trichophyton rubrum MR1448]EZF94358.1 hypothetical protein H113_05265 [Trichophyton rubr